MGSTASTAPQIGAPEQLVFVADVRALLSNSKSAWWIKRHFAPETRLRIGRSLAWYRADALRWIGEQRARP